LGLKSSLSHYPRHALVIDDETLTPQLPSHPPVPVPDVTLADSLNALDDYILIGTQTPFRAIVAGAARHIHEPARLRATEPFGPLTIEELASFADRAGGSVFLSSSFSIVSWPTLRSRAAIRASYSSKEAAIAASSLNSPASYFVSHIRIRLRQIRCRFARP